MNKFKSITAIILSIIIGTGCLHLPAFAQETMVLDWKADYKDMELEIFVQSPAKYVQQLALTMYPAATQIPQTDDYCRFAEVTANGNEKTTIKIKIADDLTETAGAYTVTVKGNGSLSELSTKSIDVWVLNPTNAGILLKRFNEAAADTIGGCINDALLPLKLSSESDEARLAKRLVSVLEIRKNDYKNKFVSLEDVKQAWLGSDLLAYLGESGTDKARMQQLLEAALELDTSDSDYTEYISTVCGSIKAEATIKGVNSCTQVKNLFDELLAVAVVNGTEPEDMEEKIIKYQTVLGIDNSTLTKIAAFSDITRAKVLRQLYQKNFNYASQISAALTDAIEVVDSGKGSSTAGGSSSSGGSSGGGGSSSGGSVGNFSTNVSAGNPTLPVLQDFNDLPSSHWAYTYVQSLRQSNIISGYPDGTFLPDSTVTREEFTKMVISAAGLYDSSAECEFEDVKAGDWYYKFVASASKAGIVNGVSDTRFGSGSNITREDTSVIAARILDKSGISIQSTSVQFADADSVSEYAKSSVASLCELKIINGFEDDTFRPKHFLTRAEAAKIIYMIRESM